MQEKIGVGHASVGELEKKYVNMALEAGRLSQGEFVYRFEQEFARLHAQKYGIACNSGTSALHAALEALKELYEWRDGSEVIVPAITFIATSNACIHANLIPVFVDVDPMSYNLDPKRIEEKITEKTVAIMPVHTFGQPCEMDAICEIAQKYKLKIVEDCAEAHFAHYKGRPVGSFGKVAGFSTYVAHTITTGVGGVITTNDPEVAEVCRSLIAHGRACTCEKCIASSPHSVCRKRLSTKIDRRFMMVRIGYSYRIGELEGALGLAQVETRDEIMTARKRNAAYLTKKLEVFRQYLQLPEYSEYIDHSFMMYPIVIKNDAPFSRQELVEYLERNNIESRPMLPLLNQPVYKKVFGDIEHKYPVAKWINNNGLYFGCHHGLTEAHLDKIVSCIDDFIADRRLQASGGSTSSAGQRA